MAGLAYQGAFQKIVTIPQDAALPYVCEFDGVGKTKYTDISLGLELAVGVGLSIGFYIPNENFGFGIEGTVDFITVSLTPTLGYREFVLYDNNSRWLGTRGETYTEGPWEVSLLACGIRAVANFVFFSAKWSLLEYPGYKVAGGKLWDVSWPTRQASAMRPEPPVEAPSAPPTLPDDKKVAVIEGETTGTEHQIGRVDGDGWSANVNLDGAGYIISGPPTSDVPAGKRMATFRMKIDNNPGGDHVARLEVVDALDDRFYASRDIYRSDFFAANTYVEFALLFEAPAGRQIRFRVYWTDRAAMTVDRITAGAQRNDLRNNMVIHHGHWGDWQGMRYCPEDSFATGYRMKVEGNQGGGDDTALNSIELQCTDREGANTILSAHPGHWGGWQGWKYCSNNSYIKSGALKIEGAQGGGDDTSANSVKVQCTDGSEMEAPGGGPWGDWYGFASCPAGQAVCGVEVRIEGRRAAATTRHERPAVRLLRIRAQVQRLHLDRPGGRGQQRRRLGRRQQAHRHLRGRLGPVRHQQAHQRQLDQAGPVRPLPWADHGRDHRHVHGGRGPEGAAAGRLGPELLEDGVWPQRARLRHRPGRQHEHGDPGHPLLGGRRHQPRLRIPDARHWVHRSLRGLDPNYFKSDCPANKAVVGVSMTVNTARAQGVLCCEL